MLSGVKEFWVINPKEKAVLVYGFKDGQIDLFNSYKKDEIIKSYWFEKLEASIKDVFES